jgi:GAF domain-containing protein
VRDQPIGTIAVVRDSERPFSEREQAMLEAVADYASISLVNARLFQALEARAQRLQQMVDQINAGALVDADWLARLKRGLRAARGDIAQLEQGGGETQVTSALHAVQADLDALLQQLIEVETRPRAKSPAEGGGARSA